MLKQLNHLTTPEVVTDFITLWRSCSPELGRDPWNGHRKASTVIFVYCILRVYQSWHSNRIFCQHLILGHPWFIEHVKIEWQSIIVPTSSSTRKLLLLSWRLTLPSSKALFVLGGIVVLPNGIQWAQILTFDAVRCGQKSLAPLRQIKCWGFGNLAKLSRSLPLSRFAQGDPPMNWPEQNTYSVM